MAWFGRHIDRLFVGKRHRDGRANPGLADALVDAFSRAWFSSETRLSAPERELRERERSLLGFGPDRYELSRCSATWSKS
jgi:hypothetical protein